MATVGDPNIKPPIPYWKIALNLLYSALTALKNMGKFSKGNGPSL